MQFKLTPYNLQELGQRQNQEDSLFPGIGQQNTNDRLFILCDGMGGHEKGEVASATVCKTMSDYLLSRWHPNEPLLDGLLQQAIDAAYDALEKKDNNEEEEKKMGTTLTLVCFHAEGVTVAHIGDSRVYQLRPATKNDSARIVFKTRDHSLINDLIDIGEITKEEAKNHPQKNVITRAMLPNQERRAKATIAHLTDIQDGDYFYLCSDGMLEQSTDENILNIITKKDAENEQKIEILRSVTEENNDNHTAHLIHINSVERGPAIPKEPMPTGSEKEAPIPQQKASPQGIWVTPEYAKKKKKRMFLLLFIAAIVLVAITAVASYFLFHGSTDKDERGKYADPINIVNKHPYKKTGHDRQIVHGKKEKEPSKEAEQVQNKDVSRQSHDTITTTPQDNGTSNNESMSPSATKSSGTQRGISQIGAIQQQILNSGKKPQAKEHATKEIMNTENSSTKEQK